LCAATRGLRWRSRGPAGCRCVRVSAVFFDVGETLVDETRSWSEWAEWLGVSPLTLCAALGAVIERGQHHTRAFEIVRPGFDLGEQRAARSRAGKPQRVLPEDLYPDAARCLGELGAAGYLLGAAGNMTSEAGEDLTALGLPLDVVGSSQAWGTSKPSPRFFARMAEAAGRPAHEIAYVGDRVDNDVVPAARAGMVAVFLRRGPWGHLQAGRPEAGRARITLESLRELPHRLDELHGDRGDG
jgi:FMN phosphatase YigB (HAD superfamily)